MSSSKIYDLRDDEIRTNPYDLFRELREKDPVHWNPLLKGWMLTRYEDVRRAHSAPELSSDRITPFYSRLPQPEQVMMSEVVRYLNLWLVFRAPPEHTRLRKLLSSGFEMSGVKELESSVESIVQLLADDLEGKTEVEFIGDFAMKLPSLVIMNLLGVPREMLQSVRDWSNDLAVFLGSSQGVEGKYQRAQLGAKNMAGFFLELIQERRLHPMDDLISKLIKARDEQDALSEDELVASCMLLLFGGNETTTNLIGNSIHCLLSNPIELQKLKSNPALIDSAVEEVLRFDGPNNSSARIVAVEHELLTKTLKPGERVFAMVNAANRDPSVFDEPDKFNIERQKNRHLAFGFGIHFCMGASLARLEGKKAVSEIFNRFPKLSFTQGKKPEWTNAMIMRGLKTLPLTMR